MANPIDPHQVPQPDDDFATSNPYASPLAVPVGSHDQRAGYVTRTDEVLDPWISMWTRPRETVRQQLDTDPWRHVLLLAALAGMSGNLGNQSIAYSEELPGRLFTMGSLALAGAVFGLAWIFIMGWLVGLTGRMIGGVGYALDCRCALAWSSVPGIWLTPLYLAMGLYYLVAGPYAFVGGAPRPGQSVFEIFPVWILVVMAVSVIVVIWQLVITCQAVGESHRFSSLRGFGALLLTLLLIMGVFIALMIVIMVIGAIVSMAMR